MLACLINEIPMQALGPVALVSLLLNDGLVKAIPGCDINENPNQPVDAHLQQIYNHAAIQVRLWALPASRVPVSNAFHCQRALYFAAAEYCLRLIVASLSADDRGSERAMCNAARKR